ncbi:MAG: cell division protein FtsW [Lachnospiraceae bacterium]|nr:cell division protein FtsW [Lachnospiraceae bacterium]
MGLLTGGKKKKGQMRLFTKGGYNDFQTAFVVGVLCLFGIMMIYSTSYVRAIEEERPSYDYAYDQAKFFVIGFLGMVLLSYLNYEVVRKLSWLLMIGSLALCVATLIWGVEVNGSKRWLVLAGHRFQPSEFAKPAIALFTAHMCTSKPKEAQYFMGMLKLTAIQILTIGAIAKENLSTGVVCAGIMIVILFISTNNYPHFALYVGIMVAGAIAMLVAMSYRSARFDAMLHPEGPNGYQVLNSLYAVGSGGFWGKGIGKGIQKNLLPESHNDMIFSNICEELGIFGAVCVLILFTVLLLRLFYMAQDARDRFGGLLVTGVLTQIAVQVIVNVGVAVNFMPNTGMALPFVSYGGTSLLMHLAEMGVLLNVVRQGNPYEKVKLTA